jgi:type II secretory pathway pseudopilin PulG
MKPFCNKRRLNRLSGNFAQGDRRRSPESAFTLVEIALCLAIIGFAMVAIIGVLPTGMTVQKENREETIINQDGHYLLEAIRSGSRGIDDLTNYFDAIIITNTVFENTAVIGRNVTFFTNDVKAPAARRLVSGKQIISLLTTPKVFATSPGRFASNIVVAYVRSITGVAAEKSASSNSKEFSFRYQLRTEVIPFASYTNAAAGSFAAAYDSNLRSIDMANNLHEIRLTLNWPVFDRGGRLDVGSNRKTFRTLVAGEIDPEDLLFESNDFLSR